MIRAVFSLFGGLFAFVLNALFMGAFLIGGLFLLFSQDLPDHETLSVYRPATISRVYAGSGRIMDEFAKERRIYAPIEEIPDVVKAAFVSAEDKNFYTHRGYDVRGIAAVIVEAIESKGANVRGASTIPQQVAKISFLDGGRRAERKIQEIILANRMVKSLDRDHILEIYLNEIFLGQNSYGVAAAAQTYFNKNLSELDPEEAAYLAVLPKAPSDYHPVRQLDRAMIRRDYVLKEMHENGYLDDAEYEIAVSQPLRTVQSGDFESFKSTLPERDYFSDEIRRQLSRDFGEDEFFSGGLTVRATVDQELQVEAALALQNGLEAFDRSRGIWRGTGKTLPAEALVDDATWRTALAELKTARDIEGWHVAVVLELGDTSARIGIEGVEDDADGHWIPAEDVKWARPLLEGSARARNASKASDLLDVGDVVYVRAMTKDSDGSFIRWTLRQIPQVQGGFMAMDVNTGRVIAMQGGFSYQDSVFNRATQADRQPGSSFKPFVYAAALDSGYSPATIVIDAPIVVETGAGVWRPKNSSNKFYGPAPLRTGIEQSRNLMTVRLAQEIGMETVAAYAERFGVYDHMNAFLANSLGAEETTLFKMVAAYAMFANGGERVEPTLVDRVQDRWGKTVYRHDQRTCSDCRIASLEPGLAPVISSGRERVMDPITAYQLTSMMQGVVQRGTAAGRVNLDVPVAGKTGTTNDSKDAWFIGFTSNIVAGCYIGYDRPRSLAPNGYGGTLCGPVFTQFMKKATEKYGGGKFKVPPGGHFIKIDRYSGARLDNAASGANVVAEYFRDGEEPLFGVAFDGGFAMGSDLPMFDDVGQSEQTTTTRTSTGDTVTFGKKATFGTISSGGEY
ncbi:penicillin-binding protein 1A [Falsihalocynthiibacter arcticus]|uniref:Penicillin-binding protein 1A n=1 Tax=Falsihalocynthiibacter arcticus TaxID=1579316 RepID=A0A126V275_9RHOB|nr:PBP1A family penicillin-binding protein [Falsihalocynthiibacter arcticus]AML52428.1 penicillin-binding protein [Falsihalocynthiibacter arcticus]